MLALEHGIDEVDFLVNPKEDFWTPLVPIFADVEGWTFVLKDFDNLRSTLANQWFAVAVEKTTNRPISCALLVLDEASADGDEPLYITGFYFTHPEWRGAGVGSKLFRMTMDIAGNGNVAMNSGLNMISHYATKFGADQIRPYILNYAQIYLKDVVPSRETKGLVAKVILNENGKVVGIGSIRGEFNGSMAIGPLYADSKEAARLIIDSLIPCVDKKKYKYMYAVYPACNSEAERLMSEVSGGIFEITPITQPQFTKRIIPIVEEKVFSVTDIGMHYV